jgi:hypothetical protein
MKQYILGHYCANDTQLGIISKQSSRRILEALRDTFPSGLNAHGVVENRATIKDSIRFFERTIC